MKSVKTVSILLLLLLLSGCRSFAGWRSPLYDGSPVQSNDEAISIYEKSQEIVGSEKDYYMRYPFSADLHLESLTYPDEEPVLLKEGLYTIGVDLPAGRVSLLGNESVFTSENIAVHVGNMIIRDETGAVYFENLFHSDYGQLVAQVDFLADHTIEIIGTNSEITVFYTEKFPEDPYLLMDPPEVLVNLDRLETQQPIVIDEEENRVQMTAGIFEVGRHLKPGLYEMKTVIAPHATELFLFHEGEDIRVFELLPVEEASGPFPQIELTEGDKLFLSLVSQLELRRMN